MLQMAYDSLLKFYGNRPGFVQRAVARLAQRLTKNMGAAVTYSVDGIPLRIPPAHETPFLWSQNSDYSKSLARVAEICAGKYPSGVILDIGANVGDSAALIRSRGVVNTIVAVEGLPWFFKMLRANLVSLGDTRAVQTFIGPDAGQADLKVRLSSAGNAHVYEDGEAYGAEASGDSISGKFITVAELAETTAPGREVKLIKTDIECYDIPVLNGSLEFLSKHRPVVFMELHIRDIDERVKGVTWTNLWTGLRNAGYTKAFYWYNSGDFLCMVDLERDARIIEDLHGYFRNRAGLIYADVCLMHSNDADLATRLYEVEKGHALKMRAADGNS